MWIEFLNKTTRKFYNEEYHDEPIIPNENHTAQVPNSVGRELVRDFEGIVEYSAKEETPSKEEETEE